MNCKVNIQVHKAIRNAKFAKELKLHIEEALLEFCRALRPHLSKCHIQIYLCYPRKDVTGVCAAVYSPDCFCGMDVERLVVRAGVCN